MHKLNNSPAASSLRLLLEIVVMRSNTSPRSLDFPPYPVVVQKLPLWSVAKVYVYSDGPVDPMRQFYEPF